MTEEEQRQYQYFRWPESMVMGLLPWEASSAALELLEVRKSDPYVRFIDATTEKPPESSGTGWGRPSVRLARAFWHITQAAPDLPALPEISEFPPYMLISGRYDIAVVLAEWEAGVDAPQRPRDAMEKYLAYAPWRSIERALIYASQVEHEQIPGLYRMDLLADYDWRLTNREDFIEFLKNEIISDDVKPLLEMDD